VDDLRFDTLVKPLSSTRLSRLTALRGLAASAAALSGMRLLVEKAGEAKKGEAKKNWCHRGDNVAILGKTKKLTKDQIKQHKKKHTADYKGKCTASRIVSPAGGGGTRVSAPFSVSACWSPTAPEISDHDTFLFVPNKAGSSDPAPHIDYNCNPDTSGCDENVYPFACVDTDETESGCEMTTVRQLLDGTYEYWIRVGRDSPAGEVTVTLRDSNGSVVDTWSSPPAPEASREVAWHVFDVDGATGEVTSKDQAHDMAIGGLPDAAHDPSTPVCPG
jgi:hypothetical protein